MDNEQEKAARVDLDVLMEQLRGYPPSRVAEAVWGWMEAQGFRDDKPAPTDERTAIIDALLDELGWEWDEVPEEHIPSSREILGDMADRVLAVSAGFRRSVVPEPSRESGWSHPEAVYSPEVFMAIQGLLNEAQGDPMHALRLAVSRQVSEPQGEPFPQVLSDWFTSSNGVAVAAVAPMTDRGPSVMVDGHVISPNDVAALIEFKAQGEPSDAQYPEVDAFAERMRAELIANAHKGDAWLNMTVRQAWSEISWHVGKLTGAIKSSDIDAIRELAADIANGALMIDQIIAVNLRLGEIGRAASAVTEQGENRDE